MANSQVFDTSTGVGIGTSAPGNKLDIFANVGSGYHLTLGDSSANGTGYPQISA